LDMFGYYSFAWVAAASLFGLVYPVTMALFPAFSELISLGKTEGLVELYHTASQFLSVLIMPPTIVIALFSREILLAWTGDPTVVENSRIVLSLLVVGTGISCLLRLPHMLQISYGWTSLGIATNAISVVVGIPLLIRLAGDYGIVGAALVWPLINAGQFLTSIGIMHSRIAKGEMWRWYLRDVGAPTVGALIPVWALRNVVPDGLSRTESLICVLVVGITALGAAVAAAPAVRTWLIKHMPFIRRRPK
jgi:O-antigen/teichoic acid export membrane protein